MTARLTLSYRQGTPLGDLRGEAWVENIDGIKTIAKGHILGPDGVTVEAEGLFIMPKWAREREKRRDAQVLRVSATPAGRACSLETLAR